ncbi:MAG: 16S rRNA (guanine(527)-N(7))-methyltransferase RsmG, partial [Sphingomicrobium sp.]
KRANAKQNLVSRGTLDDIWSRHVIDSAQLIRFETVSSSSWLDIGAGAGFPGIVIACLSHLPVTLLEPRKLRAEFLREVIDKLNLRAVVQIVKAERASGKFNLITARAVASLPKLFEISYHLSTGKTRWVFPKGQSACAELEQARLSWHGEFHVEQSLTDARSHIVVAQNVRPEPS